MARAIARQRYALVSEGDRDHIEGWSCGSHERCAARVVPEDGVPCS
jgi:hypothetical protein